MWHLVLRSRKVQDGTCRACHQLLSVRCSLQDGLLWRDATLGVSVHPVQQAMVQSVLVLDLCTCHIMPLRAFQWWIFRLADLLVSYVRNLILLHFQLGSILLAPLGKGTYQYIRTLSLWQLLPAGDHWCFHKVLWLVPFPYKRAGSVAQAFKERILNTHCALIKTNSDNGDEFNSLLQELSSVSHSEDWLSSHPPIFQLVTWEVKQ